jgi:hypothetical protein
VAEPRPIKGSSNSSAMVLSRQILGIVLLIALVSAIVLIGSPRRASAPPVTAPNSLATPAAPADLTTFRAGFLPLLERAAANADALVAMGEARERNLLRIHAAQDAMNAALQDADDWLTSHPAPATDAPAVAAYRHGEAAIRTAMDEALAGFLRFDFARVARATETMRDGASSLQRALALLQPEAAAPAPVSSPANPPPAP